MGGWLHFTSGFQPNFMSGCIEAAPVLKRGRGSSLKFSKTDGAFDCI